MVVSVCVDGQDRTGQLSGWDIEWRAGQGLVLNCYFPSGKSFTAALVRCKVEPMECLQGKILAGKDGARMRATERIEIYGRKYACVYYPGNTRPDVVDPADLVFEAEPAKKPLSVFAYFMAVAQARVDHEKIDNRTIPEGVLGQLKQVVSHEGTALEAYRIGKNQQGRTVGPLIYPFGINESQLKAVEQAFASQISLIEGPPGTGKTQTILNIIANIVLRGKTVAIVSNNNPAVQNVYAKLDKAGLGHIVARLGNNDNKKAFFGNIPVVPDISADVSESPPSLASIQDILGVLARHLAADNALARLQAEIDELRIELRHLLDWQRDRQIPASPISLEKYGFSAQDATEMMAFLKSLDGRRITLKNRFGLWRDFRILRTRPFSDPGRRRPFIHALQLHYYEQSIQRKEADAAKYREALARADFRTLLATLVNDSMLHFKCHLQKSLPTSGLFTAKGYQRNFAAFVKRFPVIGSSTHSVVNSLGEGARVDYIIIDEASQQDIVPGILALACAENLIIVGDTKQLPHIPTLLGVPAPVDDYDCEKYSLLESCARVFADSMPKTLLKEHYRCHPRIIQFCNQQFYANQLIPMTQDAGEQALELLVTAKGNHMRDFQNLREVETFLEAMARESQNASVIDGDRVFIAPYRKQVELSHHHSGGAFLSETVHKFQGRECEEVVFSTVLDKKYSSQQKIDFVDNSNLINVAVSRARQKFTLVTGDDVFAANNSHIAALIRYMEYYADAAQVKRSLVVSAFDLLYQEYDQALDRLNSLLRPEDSKFKSEQIVAQILREALSEPANAAVVFHSQIDLDQVVASTNAALTESERTFLAHDSSCDFVLYFKVGKTPLGVIEVDGGSHETEVQINRDRQKDGILEKSGVPLLRLKTTESRIEEKVAQFVERCGRGVPAA